MATVEIRPPKLGKGLKGLRKAFSDLLDFIQQKSLYQASGNLTVKQTPRGLALTDLPGATGNGGQPFLLVDASTPGQSVVRVIISTLAGLNPSGFSPGDTPPYLIPVNGQGVIYGVVVVDQGEGASTNGDEGDDGDTDAGDPSGDDGGDAGDPGDYAGGMGASENSSGVTGDSVLGNISVQPATGGLNDGGGVQGTTGGLTTGNVQGSSGLTTNGIQGSNGLTLAPVQPAGSF